MKKSENLWLMLMQYFVLLGTSQKCIENSVKHLRWSMLRKFLTTFARYICKGLHIRCLTGFWIRLCIPIQYKYTLNLKTREVEMNRFWKFNSKFFGAKTIFLVYRPNTKGWKTLNFWWFFTCLKVSYIFRACDTWFSCK